ncbi:hypothetical protein A9Q84_04330 [Halobacteriovorax marinus]|uniref:Uracil-DNA glycosylase-like domain-containing protein n=1 Tax=Halobacteriovorax marinus TaxID=97084 RepID=A0A1Y5FAD3_9BACT|nr:hypothetical protein A9Q84_04330 [Halobacteriovorax marinus]
MINYKEIRNNIKKIEGSSGLGQFYCGALFRDSSWYISRNAIPKSAKRQPVKEVEVKESILRVASKEPLSKEKVLNSLKENVEKKGPVESRFGSILKDETSKAVVSSSFSVPQSESEIADQIKSKYSVLEVESLKSINVLIVGESSFEELVPEDSPWKSSHDQSELLGKMIFSMKLDEGEFLRTPLVGKSDSEILENVLNEIIYFKPEIVITLGAVATNILYGKKEKLSKVHGSEFDRQVKFKNGELDFKFFPVFHPDLLQINPSMKRTAWIDLQKIMKLLGKS